MPEGEKIGGCQQWWVESPLTPPQFRHHCYCSICYWRCCRAQIREQMLVPDLYVLTVELVAYKKRLKREIFFFYLFSNGFSFECYSRFDQSRSHQTLVEMMAS